MADTCRSCGAAIDWGVTAKGRRIPLDALGLTIERLLAPPTPNVIVVGEFSDGTLAVEVAHGGTSATPTRVSHFATCPDRDKFRGRRR